MESRIKVGHLFQHISALLLLRASLGTLLLTAAALKTESLVADWTLISSIERTGHVLLVAWEVALAVMLWVRPCSFTWWTAGATFTAFSLASVSATVNGAEDCGCFGKLAIPPIAVLAVDAFALAGLIGIAIPSAASIGDHSYVRYGSTIAYTTAVGIFVSVFVAASTLPRMLESETGVLRLPGGVIVLQPELWVDNDFPLAGSAKEGDRLMTGEWEIVMYRPQCDECRDYIERQYDEFCPTTDPALHARVAMLRVPGSTASDNSIEIPRGVSSFTLDESSQWIVATPCVIELSNGRVLTERHGTALLRAE